METDEARRKVMVRLGAFERKPNKSLVQEVLRSLLKAFIGSLMEFIQIWDFSLSLQPNHSELR